MFGRRQHGRATRRAPRSATRASSTRSTTRSVASAQRDQRPPDRARLDDYTENVREIERRLQIAVKASTVAPTDFAVPAGVPQSFDEHIKLQFDLLALAFQADITRVGTLLFARDLTGRVYPESESPTLGFPWRVAPRRRSEADRATVEDQPVSRQDAGLLRRQTGQHQRWRRHAARSFAGALRQQHGQLEPARHYDVPHVLVGGVNGKLQGGRHLAYPTPTRDVPTGNLLLSMLDQFDIHQDSIGDSTGRLEDL